jgi:hypothetical protein
MRSATGKDRAARSRAESAIWPHGRQAQRHFLCLLAQLWLTRLKIGSQNRTPSLPESGNTDPRKPA